MSSDFVVVFGQSQILKIINHLYTYLDLLLPVLRGSSEQKFDLLLALHIFNQTVSFTVFFLVISSRLRALKAD